MKYQKGDKVVIREDLKVGKKYGNITWLEGMEPMKSMLFTTILGVGDKGSHVLDTGWCISKEMISHKYREKVEFNMKYQEGDKVVIRKDLEFGKEYGKDGWVEGMKHLANEPYVTIEHRLSEGHYSVLDTDYRITDEMISHKYEEERYVWVCEDKDNTHILWRDGSILTHTNDSVQGSTLQEILSPHLQENYLLTEEEAKKSAFYPVLQPTELYKEKLFHIFMLGSSKNTCLNYDIVNDNYFMSTLQEDIETITKFTEEESDKIIGTSTVLYKEEVG